MNKKYLILDIIKIWVLYTLSVLVVYYMGAFFKYPFFIILLLVAYRSKKDYWWLAFFLLLFAQIGNLFPETARFEGAYQRIPVYNFRIIRVPFYDLTVLIYFVKSLSKNKVRLIFERPIIIIGLYVIILYVFSTLLGMSASNHIQSIRALFQFTLLFSLPRILDKEEKYLKFYNLLFSSVFIIFILTVIEIFTGFILGSISGETYKFTIYSNGVRIINSPFLLLHCFIISMFFYFSKKKRVFSRRYLSIIIILSSLLIFLTATRGWFLSLTIMIILAYFLFVNKTNKIIIYVLPVLIILFFVLSNSNQVYYIFASITKRISTISELAEGDLTAGGTLSRLTVRMPRMLKIVEQNPITGFGFSKIYYDHADNHVGPVMQLLQMGIIGYFLYLWFFLFIFARIKEAVICSYDRAFYMLFFGIIGLNVIHFTSTAIFCLSAMGGQRATVELIAYLLTFMNFFVSKAQKLKKN